MQIGNKELDVVYERAIAPAIRDAELEPTRIDRHNEGGLLKAEIVGHLERSDIIVADLTNERPNCYLEVGYAMGLGRHRHLVLTVREDHLPGSPTHRQGGPKVHFDLAGYDLLMWTPDDLAKFRSELTRRLQRRLAITRDASPPTAAVNDGPSWVQELSSHGRSQVAAIVGSGFMEVAFGLQPPKPRFAGRSLRDAVMAATISTFGWPIGVSLQDDEGSIRATTNGIRAEVTGSRFDDERSFDLWELRTDGDFFLVQSLFEDQRGHPQQLWLDIRIRRVTEAILFCTRLYERLGVDGAAEIDFSVTHGGLAGRMLGYARQDLTPMASHHCAEGTAKSQVRFRLSEVDSRLPGIVELLLEPLFGLFDFFELPSPAFEKHVDDFVRNVR